MVTVPVIRRRSLERRSSTLSPRISAARLMTAMMVFPSSFDDFERPTS